MNDFSVKSVLKKNVMTMALFGIYVLFVILAAHVYAYRW